jgi:hypothetical protein
VAKTKTEADSSAALRNDKQESNSKDEMRGSLHCATHDETVSSFGRDDAFFAASFFATSFFAASFFGQRPAFVSAAK